MNDDRTPPRTFAHVQAEESDAIRQGRAALSLPAEGELVGLALSGGGIRSATFCLGVIQALARAKRLTAVDYLATVSGGGYIGGWLSAWIYRKGLDRVQNTLSRPAKPGVFVEAPETVKTLSAKDSFAVVESVKAASDVYAPVSGEVVEANDALSTAPETVNAAAEADGWFAKIKISDASQLDGLMDQAAYDAFLATL